MAIDHQMSHATRATNESIGWSEWCRKKQAFHSSQSVMHPLPSTNFIRVFSWIDEFFVSLLFLCPILGVFK
jgi:hypothetical protein